MAIAELHVCQDQQLAVLSKRLHLKWWTFAKCSRLLVSGNIQLCCSASTKPTVVMVALQCEIDMVTVILVFWPRLTGFVLAFFSQFTQLGAGHQV